MSEGDVPEIGLTGLENARLTPFPASQREVSCVPGPLPYSVLYRTPADVALDVCNVGRGFAPMRCMPLRPLSSMQHHTGRALDVRGWSVVSSDGTPLGIVAELIVDLELDTPVYINIEPVDADPATIDECWIRVPYRHTSLDDDACRVVLSDLATLGLGTASIAFVGRVAAD